MRVGSFREALGSAETAVDLFRSIAGASGDRSRELADALVVLGTLQCASRRHREALVATTEAVELLRKLAGGAPAALPTLAYALGTLSNERYGLGQYDLALEAAAEGVAVCRRVVAQQPDGRATSARLALAGALGRLALVQGVQNLERPAFDAAL